MEIAKGPLSALYGANAFLATVNIITRTPSEGLAAQQSVRYSRLKRDNGSTSGSVAFEKDNTSFLTAYHLGYTDRSGIGLDKTFDAQDTMPDLFDDESQRDFARPLGLVGVFRTQSEAVGALSIEGGLQRHDTMDEFQTNSLFSHSSRLVIDNWWSQARLTRSWSDDVHSDISFGYATGSPLRDTELYLAASPEIEFYPNYFYRAFNGEAELRWNIIEELSLTVGVDGEYDTEGFLFYTETYRSTTGTHEAGESVDIAVDPDEKRNFQLTDMGVHLQLEATPLSHVLPDLRLTSNARLDWIKMGDESFPTRLSWR